MTTTKGRISRDGEIRFTDAAIRISEEGIAAARAAGGWEGAQKWEREFKHDVFKRIVQSLKRIGWTVGKQHHIFIGNHSRYCTKGNLKADLRVAGRCIDLEFFQNVNAPDRPDNEGRYQYDKEKHMPFLLRIEMERARLKIRDYLCNVFTGYVFKQPDPKRGPNGLTALEYIQADVRACWHYDKSLDRRSGEESSHNNRSADKSIVKHGARVWFADSKGRICTGTAFYNINNMWWVITGRYDAHNVASFEIYTSRPENLRIKRNARQRRLRLEAELARSVKAMKFERASQLRDLLFPGDPALFNVWHDEHQLYHCAGFCGYTSDQSQAGKFTAEEVRGWDCAPNKVVTVREKEAA